MAPPVKAAGNRASKLSKLFSDTAAAGPVSLCEMPDSVWYAFSTPAKILLKIDSCVTVVVDGVDEVNEAKIASTVVGLLVRSSMVVLGVVLVDVSKKVEVDVVGSSVVVVVVVLVVLVVDVVLEMNFFNLRIMVVVSREDGVDVGTPAPPPTAAFEKAL